MLSITDLSKTYPNGVQALDGVSLDIGPGMFVLDPNRAGKSSLMNTLATLQSPDAGQMYLGEIDVLRERLWYLP